MLSDQNIITDYLKQHVNAEYVDLVGLVKKGNESLYYVTDHHWTTEGAIQSYKILVTAMGYESITDYTFEMVMAPPTKIPLPMLELKIV